MQNLQNDYLALVTQNEGVIHKVIGLYIDTNEDRKDAYQEILLQAWKSFKGFKGESKFSTWLYRISLNTVLSLIKGKNRMINNTPIEHELSDNQHSQLEATDFLYNILKSFTEIDRIVITLHLDGYKNDEISEITGLKTNNVKVKIHRLKFKLIDQLKSYSHE